MTEHEQPVSSQFAGREPETIAETMTVGPARMGVHQDDPHGTIAILQMGMLMILLALLVLATLQAS